MRYLTFSKLKAYNKAEDLTKKIKNVSKLIPKHEQNDLRSRLIKNTINMMEIIKFAWVKCRKKENFIDSMDQVVINNSELELLLSEVRMNGYIDAEIYEQFMKECLELRDLQLQMFNNASVYFEQGKAPENWFDL